MPKPPRPAPPVLDSMAADEFHLRPAPDSGSLPATDDEVMADLGHS